MIVFLRDQFVPEEQATVSIFDRGFLYGDGLFETMRLYAGSPFRWEQHMERLERGAAVLRIPLPKSVRAMKKLVDQLVSLNKLPDAILRITVSRGRGSRGYSPTGCHDPTLAMVLYRPSQGLQETPTPWRLATVRTQRQGSGTIDPLSSLKSCNRLHNVLARADAEAAGADEGLFWNARGEITEGTSSNVFWIDRGGIHTTSLSKGALAGVTRGVVAELTRSLGWKFREGAVTPEGLRKVEGVFLSLSTLGIVEALSLDGQPLCRSVRVARLQEAYAALVRSETG